MEMQKTYNPKDFEDRIYSDWENKGYFKASTQSACAAGGFMSHTDFSHVIFIVANDGKDLLFSSHTADRLKQSFAGNYYKNMNYYYINPVYNKDLQ